MRMPLSVHHRKAALKTPRSRRFARFEDAAKSSQRVESGDVRAAFFCNRRKMLHVKIAKCDTQIESSPHFSHAEYHRAGAGSVAAAAVTGAAGAGRTAWHVASRASSC